MATKPVSFLIGLCTLAACFVAAALVLPAAMANLLQVTALIAALGISFQVVFGLIGALSLGHSALFGAGAYTYAVLSLHGVPLPLCVLAACVVGAVTGWLVASVTARLGGAYFAVVTYALASVIAIVVSASDTLGGSDGLIGIRSFPPIGALSRASTQTIYAGACLTLVLVGFYALWRSRLGAMLEAGRCHAGLAASIGINVPQAVVAATAMSGVFAGLVGATYAQQARFIGPDVFGLYFVVSPLAAVVIGGSRSLLGAMLGAVVVVAIPLALSINPILNQVIGGTLLAGFALLFPRGIAGFLERWRKGRNAVFASAVIDVDHLAPPGQDSHAPGPAMEANQVEVAFAGVKAVAGVSLRLDPGEVVGLIGANGAGKSTLVNALSGRVAMGSGIVRIGSASLGDMPAYRRARAGLARTFQDNAIIDVLTARQSVTLAAARGLLLRRVTAEAPGGPSVADLLRVCGLADVADVPAGQFTYLHGRLTAIAMALATRPSVILLDEATAGLTADERVQVGRLIRALAGSWRLAVVVIEHDVEFVAGVADRIVVMAEGRVIKEGLPSEALLDPQVVSSYLGSEWHVPQSA